MIEKTEIKSTEKELSLTLLSDLTVEQTSNALITIIPIIKNFIEDEEFKKILNKKTTDQSQAAKVGMEIIEELTTLLLSKYKQETFSILGALSGLTSSEFAKVKTFDLINYIKDILKHKEVFDFFMLSVKSELKNQ